ncbi:gluconokinase [Brevibacterium sp. S111]|uniref:gluconokinase n=1 Tax=unclassified Brevibacterium TaxID=2614124 RepID=UPI00108175FC|nr:gluconokinase [Brevibacterium sp. S111]TGD10639.1 gluconokinase [Brevibacterium sp. S111]
MGHHPFLPPLVIMGVSGTGKTVLGAQVAQALDRRFVDADDLHSAANKAKMASGVPLTDADRGPWLDAVAVEAARTPGPVIACSALKRTYRDLLRASAPALVFIHLDGPRDVIAAHLARRDHEFMSPDLLDSQLATLEPLSAEESHATVDVDRPIPEVLHSILDSIARLRP